jgi:hypothetical protein
MRDQVAQWWRKRREIDLRRAGASLDALEADSSLLVPHHLEARSGALDELGFLQELYRVRGLDADDPFVLRAHALRERLEAVDERLFRCMRQGIRAGSYTPGSLRAALLQYADQKRTPRDDIIAGYDALDVLVHGLLLTEPTPQETVIRSPEMVQYEATPARVVLAMVDDAQIGPEDVFYDLGAGLGHVAILVHLLTGARTYGVEIERAFCDYARASVARLELSGVSFVNADARCADYRDGNVFFLFTPFRGSILHAVLGRLREQAALCPIRVCSYGTCTREIAQMPWLQVQRPEMVHDFRLAVFHSLPPGTIGSQG